MVLNLLAQAAARPALEGDAHPEMFVFLVLLMVGIVALAWKLREPRQGSDGTARPYDLPAAPAATQSVEPRRHDASAAPPVEPEPREVQRNIEQRHVRLVDRPGPPHARGGRPLVRPPRDDSPTVC